MINLPPKYFAPNFYYDTNDKEVNDFYSELSQESAIKNQNTIFHKKIMWDIFRYSLSIGIREGKELDFKRSKANLPTDYMNDETKVAIFVAMFSLDDVDLSILKDPKKIQTTCENYANYGVRKLIKLVNDIEDPSEPSKPYVEKFKELVSMKE